MKNFYFISISLCLFTLFTPIFAQQKTEISFFGGLSLPQGNFGSKDELNSDAIYAMTGGSGGVAVTKYLNSSIGIGVQLAANFNPVDEDSREGALSFLSGRRYEIGDYFNATLTPYIRFQKSINRTSLYLQAGYGIGYYKSPRHKFYQSDFLIDYKAKGILHHQVCATLGISRRISSKKQIGIQIQGYHSSPSFDLEVEETHYIDNRTFNYGYGHSLKITTINPQLFITLDISKKMNNE